MNLQKAKAILKLQKDTKKGLFSSSGQEYFSWLISDEKICLDGNFTWQELEVFSWWMRKFGKQIPHTFQFTISNWIFRIGKMGRQK